MHRSPENIIEDRSNGAGTLFFQPPEPNPPRDLQYTNTDNSSARFVNFYKIIEQSIIYKSLLLEGAPGSGKSNLCQDLEMAVLSSNVPLLRITLHINAGTLRKAVTTLKLLDTFEEQSKKNGGMFILDNVDYPGYKGSSRTRKSAAQYSEIIVPRLTQLVNSPFSTALGTCHDEQWRVNKWQWNDPVIDNPSKDLLKAYKVKLKFMGKMKSRGVTELLINKGIAEERAHNVTRKLGELGMLNFHVANHIDIDLFETNSKQAIKNIMEGRKERMKARRIAKPD
jgi:hypothetical protein